LFPEDPNAGLAVFEKQDGQFPEMVEPRFAIHFRFERRSFFTAIKETQMATL
jgi:hypothetical protein